MVRLFSGRYYAAQNRGYNDMFRVCGYIRSQNDEPVRSMRYGCRTMDYNGCEVIACYHALLSLGLPASLADTADECSEIGLWLGGLFGTYPHALYRFCRAHGLLYRRYPRPTRAKAIAEDVLLYAYWNPRFWGIHTVELHRTAAGFAVTNYMPLAGCRFPTAEAALSAIRTPMPILCLGVRKA